jgi:hypothetical protein
MHGAASSIGCFCCCPIKISRARHHHANVTLACSRRSYYPCSGRAGWARRAARCSRAAPSWWRRSPSSSFATR